MNSIFAMSFPTYSPDILGHPFQQATIPLENDYEGKTEATFIRFREPSHKRALLYIHGFNDYFFQREMAEQVITAEIDFYAVDLRKYGRSLLSHQKMNNCRSLTEYFEEIHISINQIVKEGHDSIILMGHSTGGLTIPLFAKYFEASLPIEKIVVNSPFWDFQVQPILKNFGIPLVSKLGGTIPKIPIKPDVSPYYGESLHTNYRGEWSYNLDWKPIIPPPVSFGWIHAIKSAQNQLINGKKIQTPVLCMHSDKSLLSRNWTEKFYNSDAVLNVDDMKKNAPEIAQNVELTEITDGMHDLFLSSKPVREKAYQVLKEFLER
jgi:alpha-beta hydrolase superfamily lysophospholipase